MPQRKPKHRKALTKYLQAHTVGKSPTQYTEPVLLERCPECDAGAGGFCTDLTRPGVIRNRPHVARVRLAHPRSIK